MDKLRQLIMGAGGWRRLRDFAFLTNLVKKGSGEHSKVPQPALLAIFRKGHPGGLFLYAGLFPVVKAWSPFGRKSDEEDQKPNVRGSPRFRLVNKSDKALLADIIKADELYQTGNKVNYEEAYTILAKHKGKPEPEVNWRIARLLYNISKSDGGTDKKQKIEESYALLQEALEIDQENFAVHKWMAIILNEVSCLQGIKAQILESFNVRKHMLRAAELQPDDATCIYLLGHWCYTVADVPWYQRKIGATLFAAPPECSFEEAYGHFLRAERTQPGFYSMNLLMLAKSALKLGHNEKAEEYLVKLKDVRVKTEDDFVAKKEGKAMLDQLYKQANFDRKEIPKTAAQDSD